MHAGPWEFDEREREYFITPVALVVETI